MTIKLSLKSILYIGSITIFSITSLSFLCIVALDGYGINIFEGTFKRFIDFDSKQTISTWYTSSLLLLATGVLFLISRIETYLGGRYAGNWLGLMYVFLFFSIDRSVGLHHAIQHDLMYRFPKPFCLDHATTIGIELLIGVLYLLKNYQFFFSFSLATKRVFLIAALLYFVMPVGAEFCTSQNWFDGPNDTLNSTLSELLEECFEMSGVLVFTLGLFEYLAGYGSQFTLTLVKR